MKKILAALILLTLSSPAFAGDLTQQFKDPAFSGAGWGSYVVTIQQEEQSRKQALIDAQNAAAQAAATAAANTPMAKFINLFTSQVYSQLATQLSNNLFGGAPGSSTAGTFKLDGNTISYVKSNNDVTLTVVDSSGNQTVVTVPIATFAF